MPKYQYTEEENERFELIKPGDYPFEIVGYEAGISTSDKTRGCEQMDIKLRFFSDATLTRPIGLWMETITFPESSTKSAPFLRGVLNSLGRSTGTFSLEEPYDYDEASTVGLRGWAHITQEPSREKDSKGGWQNKIDPETGKPMMRNKVDRYVTDKPRIPRAPRVVEPEDEWK